MKTDSTRIAKPADAAKITAVINAAFRIAEKFFLDEDRITQTEVEELLGKGAFLLAETDDQLDGCVYVELRGERSYLGLLSVDPDRQQGGLHSMISPYHRHVARAFAADLAEAVAHRGPRSDKAATYGAVPPT